MEGHGPDILGFGSQKQGKPVLQLPRRFVGKCDGDDAPRHRRRHRAEAVRPQAVSVGDVFPQAFQESNIRFRHCNGDLLRIAGPAEAHQIGDPVDQHRGLAAAGSGKQQQRALGGQDRLPLHGVELAELSLDVGPPGGKKTGIHLFVHSHTCPKHKMGLF